MKTTSKVHLKSSKSDSLLSILLQYIAISLSFFYQFPVIHIRFTCKYSINKETCEYQRLRKMNFLEIFDFQCIYLTKLECIQPFLKSLKSLPNIRDDMVLCQCACSRQSNTNSCHCPEHSVFQLVLSKKQTYKNDFIQ